MHDAERGEDDPRVAVGMADAEVIEVDLVGARPIDNLSLNVRFGMPR
jgi:hypothetical protein